MSTFFARARFGVVFLIAALAISALAIPQARAADLSAQVLIASKTVTYNSRVAAFKPVTGVGGETPYSYAVSPTLPFGLELDSAAGTISGLPAQPMSTATYEITVTDNLGAKASASFSLTVAKAAVKIDVSATPSTVTAGESVTFSATVTPAAIAMGIDATVPTGKVTFQLSANSSQTVDLVNGTATLTTSALTYGATTTVVARYEGDEFYAMKSASTQVTVNTKATTLSLSADKSSAQAGQSITFTATISPSTATGSITFMDGTTTLGSSAISSGVATFTTSTLSVGTHSVMARYALTDVWSAADSSTVSIEIKAASLQATTTELKADRTSIAPGDSVTLTATVSPKTTGTSQASPTGKVTLQVDGATYATGQLSNGTATFTVKMPTAGSFVYEALYEGDSTYSSSRSGTTTITVTSNVKSKPKLTLGTSKSTYSQGENVTINVSIDPATASGSISFYYNTNSLVGVRTLMNGLASFTTSSLPSGTITLTATYGGDNQVEAGTSNTVTITIGSGGSKSATNLSLSASTTTPSLGAAVIFTIDVAPSAATGVVTLREGTSTIGSASLASGRATITLSTLSSGSHSITASYAGDKNYLSSVSSAVVIDVGKATATLKLSATPTSAAIGQTIAFTARIQPSTATGSISFKEGSVEIGTATLSNGVAVLRISTLAEGSHSIRASYAGNSGVSSVTSDVVTVSVQGNRVTPTEDKNARAIIGSQLATITRSATTHVSALHMRMETLHDDDVPAFANTISFSQPGQLPTGASSYEDDPWIRGSVMPESRAARQIDGVFGRPGSLLGAPSVKDALGTNSNKGSAPQFAQSFNVWTSGAVLFGGTTVTSLGAETKSKFALNGVMLGADTRLTDRVRVGVAFGYSSESNDLGSDGTKASSSTVSGSLYSSIKLNQNVFVDGSLGYGSMNFKSTRFDTTAGSLFSGSRTGKLLLGSLAVSYDRTFGALKLAPYLRAEMASATLDSYTEQGDVAFALVYDAQQVSTQNITLGLRSQYDMERSWGVLSPAARVEYRRTMGGSMMQPIAYASDPQSTYNLSSVAVPTDTLTATIGVKLRDKKQMSGSLDYIVSASQGGVQGQGLRGAVNKGF